MTKALDTPLVRIVDDDAEQLKSLAFLLRMGGWEVMTYQSAAAFLEMDDPRRSGCLLLDHRMPNMTGMELHETLVERGSLLPVIFLSAHGDIPMAMQAVHRGAMDFLVKPAAPEVLLAAVEKAVKKNLADIAAEAGQVDLAQKAALLTERELEVARLVAQGLLNIQYLIDPDVISLGGSISQNPDFIKGVQKAVGAFVDRYEEYTIAPVIQACTYQADANLYGALVNWLQEENQW